MPETYKESSERKIERVTTATETYRGWTNKPTWLFSAYFSRGDYDVLGLCEKHTYSVYALAEALKGLLEGHRESTTEDPVSATRDYGGLLDELLIWAADRIDWLALAEHYRRDYETESAA